MFFYLPFPESNSLQHAYLFDRFQQLQAMSFTWFDLVFHLLAPSEAKDLNGASPVLGSFVYFTFTLQRVYACLLHGVYMRERNGTTVTQVISFKWLSNGLLKVNIP